jgi:hypothetical protein
MIFVYTIVSLVLIPITAQKGKASLNMKSYRSWYVGRVPPSRFEYEKLNGYYTPLKAKNICEKDLECGGFTFKGTKNHSYIEVEVYFFHFVSDASDSLNEYIQYPHWTTYIVGSRNYIVIVGTYDSQSGKNVNIRFE